MRAISSVWHDLSATTTHIHMMTIHIYIRHRAGIKREWMRVYVYRWTTTNYKNSGPEDRIRTAAAQLLFSSIQSRAYFLYMYIVYINMMRYSTRRVAGIYHMCVCVCITFHILILNEKPPRAKRNNFFFIILINIFICMWYWVFYL